MFLQSEAIQISYDTFIAYCWSQVTFYLKKHKWILIFTGFELEWKCLLKANLALKHIYLLPKAWKLVFTRSKKSACETLPTPSCPENVTCHLFDLLLCYYNYYYYFHIYIHISLFIYTRSLDQRFSLNRSPVRYRDLETSLPGLEIFLKHLNLPIWAWIILQLVILVSKTMFWTKI